MRNGRRSYIEGETVFDCPSAEATTVIGRKLASVTWNLTKSYLASPATDPLSSWLVPVVKVTGFCNRHAASVEEGKSAGAWNDRDES